MKRFSAREFLFLCAPIALVGAGVIGMNLLHPPREPDAVIALNVTRDPNPSNLSTPLDPEISFGWNATAKGGPQEEIQLFYAQNLVALGDGRSQILFQQPASPAAPNSPGVNANSGGGGAGPAFQSKSQNMGIAYKALPIWTKRVEWRGDFVAIPVQSGAKSNSGVGDPTTFATLARFKGAARKSVILPVAFDAEKLAPLQSLTMGKVSPTNAGYGADIQVRTRFRTLQSRIYARLVAFDGKTKRQLWSNLHKYDEKYWITGESETAPYVSRDSDFFKLRDVPVQWGELVYIVDAAFNPASASENYDSKPADAAEIARLKKRGWLTFSRRLTVRRAGAKIVAPAYSKTPNTKVLGTQTSVSNTDWIIKVRLQYNGPLKNPEAELDAPYGAQFFGSNGKSLFSGYTGVSINKSSKPDEYLAIITVPLKDLGQPQPVNLKMDIADPYAAPLHFQTKLQIPQPPK